MPSTPEAIVSSYAQAVACKTDFEILGKAAQTSVRNAYGSSDGGQHAALLSRLDETLKQIQLENP